MSYYAIKRALREAKVLVDLAEIETLKLSDSAGNIINPATEETLSSIDSRLSSIDSKVATEATLAAIKAKTDLLTFDTDNNLLIAINKDNIGLATEATLAAIRAKTDQLQFDASGNLKVAPARAVTTITTDDTDPSPTKVIDKFVSALIVHATVKLDTAADNFFMVRIWRDINYIRMFKVEWIAASATYYVYQDEQVLLGTSSAIMTQQLASLANGITNVFQLFDGEYQVSVLNTGWALLKILVKNMYVNKVDWSMSAGVTDWAATIYVIE